MQLEPRQSGCTWYPVSLQKDLLLVVTVFNQWPELGASVLGAQTRKSSLQLSCLVLPFHRWEL